MAKCKKEIPNHRSSLTSSQGVFLTWILAYSWEACGTCGSSYCYCLWICGACGSPLEFVRTFLVRPSFAFSFLWPPSRGFMLGFCRNPGYATSFSGIFSAFLLFFFPFLGFLLPCCPFFSLSFFICFFPNWASCPLVCLAIWPFVHSFFCGNPAKVPCIYIL